MKFLEYTEDCAKQFNLIDFVLLKLCVGSAGVIAGLFVPKKGRKSVLATASIIFSFTLFPLMFKLVGTIAKQERKI